MEIKWFGQSFFVVRAKKGKKVLRIAMDPYNGEIGLPMPKIEAQILLISCKDCEYAGRKADIKGSPFVIDEPGEYETEEVLIQGIRSFRDNKGGKENGLNIIYKFKAEEMNICHLGMLGQKELAPEQLEKIGEVDILMVPVGDIDTIGGKDAAEIVAQIEPKIVIPMHYRIPALNIKLDGVDKFLKNIGAEKTVPVEALEISSSRLSGEEETEVIILEPQK